MIIPEIGGLYMQKKRLIDLEKAKSFLKDFCMSKNIEYLKAKSQIRVNSTQGIILCVSNPDAPEPDGLANDIETLMLPTLWIKEDEAGELYAVETEYTKKFLYGEEG